METKYFNDAIIGNKNMTVSLSKNGELLRLFNQAPDYKQFFEFFHVGVQINDSALIYLHNDVNNNFRQFYIDDTNVLTTEIVNTYFNLKVTQIDFVLINEDLLVRRYHFVNNLANKLNFISLKSPYFETNYLQINEKYNTRPKLMMRRSRQSSFLFYYKFYKLLIILPNFSFIKVFRFDNFYMITPSV